MKLSKTQRGKLMSVISSMEPHPTWPHYVKPSNAKMREMLHKRSLQIWKREAAKKGVIFNINKCRCKDLVESAKKERDGLKRSKESHKLREKYINSMSKKMTKRSAPFNVRTQINPLFIKKFV